MKHATALILTLCMAVLAACATAGAGAGDEGVRPRDTAGTRQASIHLVQAGLSEGEEAREEYEEALAAALEGIEEMPENPKAYLIAGQASVGLQEWVRADTMFDRALELYPGYADQLEAEREEGWIAAYQLGAQALEGGDLDRAAELFGAADRLFQSRPEARIALGSVYAQQGDAERAAEYYLSALEISEDVPEGLSDEQREAWMQNRQAAALNATDMLAQTGDFERAASVLEDYLEEFGDQLDADASRRMSTALAGFYAQAGQSDRAEEMYEEILGREDLTSEEYLQAGVGFFNSGDFEQAAAAFGAAVEMNPYSRDALLNLVQSLYSRAMELEESGEASDAELRNLYRRTVDAGVQLRELDPLNRNLVSFMLRSYRSLTDLSSDAQAAELAEQTQQLFRDYQNQRFEIANVRVAMRGGEAQVTGTFTNLAGEAGQSVQVRFELLDENGASSGTSAIDIQVPEQGSSIQFDETIAVAGSVAGWRYSLIE